MIEYDDFSSFSKTKVLKAFQSKKGFWDTFETWQMHSSAYTVSGVSQLLFFTTKFFNPSSPIMDNWQV